VVLGKEERVEALLPGAHSKNGELPLPLLAFTAVATAAADEATPACRSGANPHLRNVFLSAHGAAVSI
jgi:hypothetical protein